MIKEELTLINNFKVTSADTDINGRLKQSALENFLIQSAINSAAKLGFGFDEMQKNLLFWVLSRIDIEIYRPILWNEEISVETWPKNLDKILYLRDFIVRDSKNEIVAKSASGWLAVDYSSKRPKKIDFFNTETFYILKDKHAIDEVPQKINAPQSDLVFNVKSSFFDIDLNKHVTSTRYLDWMIDTFDIDYLIKNYPKKISINYIRETMPNETIEIMREEISEKNFIFEGKNMTSNSIAFRGKIGFEI
jgi:acyl-ACP thioesterase